MATRCGVPVGPMVAMVMVRWWSRNSATSVVGHDDVAALVCHGGVLSASDEAVVIAAATVGQPGRPSITGSLRSSIHRAFGTEVPFGVGTTRPTVGSVMSPPEAPWARPRREPST